MKAQPLVVFSKPPRPSHWATFVLCGMFVVSWVDKNNILSWRLKFPLSFKSPCEICWVFHKAFLDVVALPPTLSLKRLDPRQFTASATAGLRSPKTVGTELGREWSTCWARGG